MELFDPDSTLLAENRTPDGWALLFQRWHGAGTYERGKYCVWSLLHPDGMVGRQAFTVVTFSPLLLGLGLVGFGCLSRRLLPQGHRRKRFSLYRLTTFVGLEMRASVRHSNGSGNILMKMPGQWISDVEADE